MSAYSPYPVQQWCRFSHPEHGACAFGLGHRIEYHYCDGHRYGLNGEVLRGAEFARITNNGTR